MKILAPFELEGKIAKSDDIRRMYKIDVDDFRFTVNTYIINGFGDEIRPQLTLFKVETFWKYFVSSVRSDISKEDFIEKMNAANVKYISV